MKPLEVALTKLTSLNYTDPFASSESRLPTMTEYFRHLGWVWGAPMMIEPEAFLSSLRV